MKIARDFILERLEKDLIGPDGIDEILGSRPSDVYLTGILWPVKQHQEEDDEGELGSGSDDGAEDGCADESAPPRSVNKPSSAGVSFAFSGEGNFIVDITFGTYSEIKSDEKGSAKWQRKDWKISLDMVIENGFKEIAISEAPAGCILYTRVVSAKNLKLCTVTLANQSELSSDVSRSEIESATFFQVQVQISPRNSTKLVARPSTKAIIDDDDKSNALLYRASHEYATGHTCSAEWHFNHQAEIEFVKTSWIPRAIVPKTKESGHEVFNHLAELGANGPLGSDWLSKCRKEDLIAGLRELTLSYKAWLNIQTDKTADLEASMQDAAIKNLATCHQALTRMESGIELIENNSDVRKAFQLANAAMTIQRSWSNASEPLVWRPFQLAFILLTCESLLMRNHEDRKIMDLLWFPTGGGKTEAYLGLIAMLAFYRRLHYKNDPDKGAGTAAIMRYTLRLLTTQQFERASAVILACEAIRLGAYQTAVKDFDLGKKPFSIGLWVGGDATPNNAADAAIAMSGGGSGATPVQLKKCPCCGSTLEWKLINTDECCVQVSCADHSCILHFSGNTLPIHTVDTDVYTTRPTLLIGTVDKFAQITRSEKPRSFLGLDGGDPPDLVLQDELHLISGPLGTITGLYEVALDRLMTRENVRPKIIGSTATIRRASDQVLSLFDRETFQFPPPAIDSNDSGFAVIDNDHPGRMYAGVTSAGRSPKFTLQAVAASLLQSASILDPNDRDAYWTLLGYFNSLRELGGALVMMQDDVHDSIRLFADRNKENSRELEPPEELTSRRSQNEIVEMLDILKVPAGKAGCVDAVLATNMVSVGVDVPRLAMMLVNGQPKSIAEYIQSTSRVGRGRQPGLIVSVLNNSKARDKSHYETFTTWHQALYRDVEATSVTPFAPRSRDRALHAVLVALIRHLVDGMESSPRNIESADQTKIETLIREVVDRALRADPEEKEVRNELEALLNRWKLRLPQSYFNTHQPKSSLMQDADRAAALRAAHRSPGEAWPTMNNVRSVEPSTKFRLYFPPRTTADSGENNG